MTFLLDANVLIALLDGDHVDHDPTTAWFEDHGHLLAGAGRARGGQLATLDRRLSRGAVEGGQGALHLIQ